ncbi:transglycosylase domain-containing protein [Candidatus Parcubacteria bacterium]|nr:transglycosylase domain-containing protein [Candidatus Parcubacteria bacterium]
MKILKFIGKTFIFFFSLIFVFFLTAFILFLGLFLYYIKDLPRPEVFQETLFPQSTKIYDRTGKILLYEIYGEERRIWVPLDKIPLYLRNAVIAVEDANFYSHFGIDIKGVMRAIIENLKLKKPVYGGSTIPQQLVRIYFLSLEKTPERKLREIILAIELDRKYSKDQILEWYLNAVPLGQNAYGVEAASEIYFGKSVTELTVGEAATLAALIRAPYLYSPITEEGREKLLARKDYVLARMKKLGFLSESEFQKAKDEKIEFKKPTTELKAPYFTLWVKEILEKKFGRKFLERAGYKVYTSLDLELQTIAEEVVKKGVEKNKIYNAYNACLVAIDPRNGEVLAMTVGTGNYYDSSQPQGCIVGKNCKFDPQVNMCLLPRQPGSAFKPIVYLLAFQKGYSDQTLVLDAPTNFGKWGQNEYWPQNYDGKYRGWVTLREALAQSLNIPSVKVLYLIGLEEKLSSLGINNFLGLEKIFQKGIEQTIDFAKLLGITSLNKPLSEYGPSIVLGGIEVSPLELTLAFSIFANGGNLIQINPIIKIEDLKGNIVYQPKKSFVKIIDKKYTDLLTDVLSDNKARAPMFGLRSPLYFENYKVAVKTGTTQNFKDLWTVGYVPSLAVGVWVGNNDNSPTLKEPGVFTAGPIWHEFLEKVLPKREFNSF